MFDVTELFEDEYHLRRCHEMVEALDMDSLEYLMCGDSSHIKLVRAYGFSRLLLHCVAYYVEEDIYVYGSIKKRIEHHNLGVFKKRMLKFLAKEDEILLKMGRPDLTYSECKKEVDCG